MVRLARLVPELTRSRLQRLRNFSNDLRDEGLMPLITTGFDFVAPIQKKSHDKRKVRPGFIIAGASVGLAATLWFIPISLFSTVDTKVPAVRIHTLSPIAAHTYTVQRGDTLGSIAYKELGDRRRWREIVRLNTKTLHNPDNLEVASVLTLPKLLGH